MPELPEVEVTRQGLLAQLPGRTVVHIACSRLKLRGPIPQQQLRRHILGRQVLTVDRRAKYLLVRMIGGAVLVLHLGMTGKLSLVSSASSRHKHDHVILSLDNDSDLRFNDSRRFGVVVVWPAAQAPGLEQAFSAKEGIEPFGPEFTAERLWRLAVRKKTTIKALLMNSRCIAGIGNIYANEVLFASRIHPQMPADQLSQDDWQRLVQESRRILTEAIKAGGSTIADFLGANGHPGYFQLQLKVYGHQGEPCPDCGNLIIKTVLAGRATFLCPVCQKFPLSRRKKETGKNAP